MTSATDTPAPARNPGIDLLRGLSIVLVVIHHMAIRFPLKKGVLAGIVPGRLLDALQWNGYEAVFIFFVVSGFLITSNALARWGRIGAINLPAFYKRRAARILPCLLALVAVLSALHLAGFQAYHIGRNGQTLLRAAGAALGLHLNWYEGHTGYLPGNWDVLWSLSIEEVFYLGFPLACLLLRRRRFLAPVLAALALSLPWARSSLASTRLWQEYAYLPGMAAIAVGILAALAASSMTPSRALRRALALAGALATGAVLCFEDVLWKGLGNATLLLLALAAAALVMAFHASARETGTRPLPGTAWLRSFGRLSYEVYLTHMFVVVGCLQISRWRGDGPAWGVLWYVPALALSWALGWAVARGFSAPCEKALRQAWG